MVNTETNDKGTELSLGLYLAANGFDVWIGGSRGVEPTAHVKYNPTDSEFWKWSYDEMALFDVPAYIRYISRTNGGDQKLKYIGHSQVRLLLLYMILLYLLTNLQLKAGFYVILTYICIAIYVGMCIGHSDCFRTVQLMPYKLVGSRCVSNGRSCCSTCSDSL